MIENSFNKIENKLKTEQYYVAFIDILGIRVKYRKNKESTLKNIWDACENIILKDGVLVRTFSDNFLFYSEIKNGDKSKALKSLIDVIGNFAIKCLYFFGLAIRGSVSFGEMHIDDKIVLGEPLFEAYETESSIAVYPRIIINNNVQIDNQLKENLLSEKIIDIDFDGMIYLNIFWFLHKNEKCIYELEINSIKTKLRGELNDAELNNNIKGIAKINYLIDKYKGFFGDYE